VDSRFSFLSTAHADLLNEILARRSPTLLERIRQAGSVSRSHAEEIMSVISDEVTENLDDDWEPTDYGQACQCRARAVQRCSRQRVALNLLMIRTSFYLGKRTTPTSLAASRGLQEN
jgi:hypothetical protein